MMKKTMLAGLAILALAPLAAQASCDSVKADITQKIVANGLPEANFKLDIVPNDQADKAGGQVVGHCQSDTQKIIYTKTSDSVDDSAKTGTSQDAPSN